MKWIKLFENYGKKITCEKCEHSWEMRRKIHIPISVTLVDTIPKRKTLTPKSLKGSGKTIRGRYHKENSKRFFIISTLSSGQP